MKVKKRLKLKQSVKDWLMIALFDVMVAAAIITFIYEL